jgi:hypothetical protein
LRTLREDQTLERFDIIGQVIKRCSHACSVTTSYARVAVRRAFAR